MDLEKNQNLSILVFDSKIFLYNKLNYLQYSSVSQSNCKQIPWESVCFSTILILFLETINRKIVWSDSFNGTMELVMSGIICNVRLEL